MKPATPRLLWWLMAALALALLMVPLFMVELPPLLDYPNHLARQWFLARVTHDPILARFYAPHWAVIPNMALDLLMIVLQSFLPLYVGGKTVIALTIIIQISGALAYSRALFARFSPWALGVGLIGYNTLLLLGFVSFLLGLGLALFAAAAWVKWRESHPITTTIGLAIAALGIFFVHLLAVAFLGFLVGCIELDRFITACSTHKSWTKELASRALSLLAVFLPSALLYLALAPKQQIATFEYLSLQQTIAGISFVFSTYDRFIDALAFNAILAILLFLLWRNRAAFPRVTVLQFVVLTVLYFCCPFRLDDEAWLNVRVVYMAGLVVFAGVAPAIPRRAAIALSCVAAGLFCARVISVSMIWHDFGAELADFRRVIAPVEPGSKVLTATLAPKENMAYWNKTPPARRVASLVPADMHLPALLMIEHRAFWPMLFSVPAQHTVRVQPAFLPLSMSSGDLPRYQALTAADRKDLFAAPYLRDWQKNFDYVLIMNAGGIADLRNIAPGKLDLLTQADIAALYRVTPPARDQLFDATTSTRSSGPPSVAPPTAVTSIKLDDTPRAMR